MHLSAPFACRTTGATATKADRRFGRAASDWPVRRLNDETTRLRSLV